MQRDPVINEKFTLADKLRHLKNFGDQTEFAFRNPNERVTISNLFSHTAQLVRSAGHWSLGLKQDRIENSIYVAYLELIEKAQYFIYIENQFFISDTAGSPVRNKIVQALLLRIRRAIEEGAPFKVVVVIPLLPGFEGAIEEKGGAFTRLTLSYQQQTISKGPGSLLEEYLPMT
jgi:phospholipase D1/2